MLPSEEEEEDEQWLDFINLTFFLKIMISVCPILFANDDSVLIF